MTKFFILLLVHQILWAQTIDSTFSNPTTLTDSQMNTAKTFEHQGVKDQAIATGCAQKGLKGCKAIDDGVNLESLIGKAYAMLGVLTSGGIIPTLTSKPKSETPTTATADASKPAADAARSTEAAKPETQYDYCMMVAMGYEALGGMIQTNLQKKADSKASGISDTQLQSLVSLKESHKARKTTAKIQSTIYAGVTACYGAMAYSGKIALDWKYWAKVAGSTALTGLYLRKVAKHDDAAKQVQAVIDSLPKAGDCNPYTGTTCFCAEATSKNLYPVEYQEVCVLNKGSTDANLVDVGCGTVVNNTLKFDETCACKTTNTCLKSTLSSAGFQVSTGANLMTQANTGFDLLSNGEFDSAKVDSYLASAAVQNSKLKGKVEGSVPPAPTLSAEEKKIAEELKPYMPTSMANAAAAGPSTYPNGGSADSIPSAGISKLPAEMKQKLASAIGVSYKRNGGGFDNSQDSSPQMAFQMPNFGAANKEEAPGTEVVSFAEQAISKADVSNAPETPIFDIISNRYKKSGWDKLQRVEK